jgi:acyl-CoA synthetase (AMP-forming)/AMP-acid ligase II
MTFMEPRQWLEAPRPGRGIRFATDDGGWEYREYPEIAATARRVASALLADGTRPGDTVCVLIPSGFHCLTAFFGAWAVGVTPCLITPPEFAKQDEYVTDMARILEQAAPSKVITSPEFAAVTQRALAESGLGGTPWLWREDPAQAPVASVEPGESALLQFTSGSSGMSHGIPVSWANLKANVAMIRDWSDWQDDDALATWLPLYHDMGLGSMMTTVISQCDLWLMRPVQFIRDPGRWLECMASVRLTAAPAFAFEYVVRRVRPERLAGLDLSGLRLVWVGAEPIDPVALEDFARLTESAGFSRATFMPAYGMAEATLAITASSHDELPRVVRPVPGSLEFGRPIPIEREGRLGEIRDLTRNGWMVGCGAPRGGTEVVVLDEDCSELPPGHLGEIAVRGPAVTSGYYAGRTATSTRFVDGQLRTGDAGFVYGGDLFVLGRMADSLKLRGRHVFAEELESKIVDATGLPRQRCVVVSVPGGGDTSVALFVEASPGGWGPVARQVLRAALGPEVGVRVMAGRPGLIMRTTSGKPRRRQMWERFLSGRLDDAALLIQDSEPKSRNRHETARHDEARTPA